ncbi:biosynthetic-type acetolactate synthase large subunit [Candidatus Bathyarchaeota archaeon]|nr:MAG: acetolactate synthase, large subunit, biosynthetic type [Candidatus Bathyarchaeota archaeon ex4484_40]RJS68011.1 MAG: biosynthetic-type acetolactate synthase large subunit [Candidatus Bathyarchaeota archaeon]RJS79868.1 MAG: biosynthetic-type acetolactate synthase large subunit [Candidatus Bathyarchaeota archaeon]RLG98659.1 MAG: biosynthetic-type acetolactate synthase large subunit [Candidatus Bathyarchaeota archaeon]HDJ04824.1 biosynthetic-type acetolactate synthase large subunit [Candi
MVEMSGAEALVEALKRERVKVIFGIIGGAIMPVYDVLRDSGIRHVLVRHEQCAAHAADGYARALGRPGVCMATSGPGATNLVTGIATAYMDSSPVIAITGQVNRRSSNTAYMIGRDAFQEADIIGITTPITKYNYQLTSVSEVPRVVKEAFYIATTGRPGPVLLDFPKDIQTERAEVEFPGKVEIRGYKPVTNPHPLQVKKAVDALLEAERPVILAGGGVILSNATPELLKVAEFLMAPVVTTFMGKGAIPENHPLSLGCIGMHGSRAANSVILDADVLLAVGTRFGDRSTGTLDTFCRDAKIIHIDIDSAEIGKNVDVDIPIVADAKKALRALYEVLASRAEKKGETAWFRRVKELKEQYEELLEPQDEELKPPRLLRELRKIIPEDSIVTTEVGQNQMWASLYFKTYKPRTFISSGGLGTMGFGFPAAIGAKTARPDRFVVDIAGDGSFRMTEQELATSVVEDIPVTVVILNNSTLGMVAQWQRLFFDERYVAVDLKGIPDFVKLAEAYGAQGVRVGSLKEFVKAVKEAMRLDVTTVIDVPIPPEENVLPMVPPGKSLKEMIE